MEGLNIMQPKYDEKPQFSAKTMVFNENTVFDLKTAVFPDFALKVVKLTNRFHSRVRTQGGHINFLSQKLWFLLKTVVFRGFFGQTKDHLPRKGNPYILLC